MKIPDLGGAVVVANGPAESIRLLLQQLEGQEFPDSLRQKGLDAPFYAAQFKSPLFAERADVVLLSIEPDLRFPIWQHKDERYCFSPPLDWEQSLPAATQRWLNDCFQPLGLISVGQFEADLLKLVRELKRRYSPAILIQNASSIDPHDALYSYRDQGDSLALQIHRLNLAVLKVSALEGISVVDVDRLVAEFGGDHVLGPLQYSSDVCQAIDEEVIRIINDLGLLGVETDLLALTMPFVDLTAQYGTISTWLKQIGDQVCHGDPLLELELHVRKLRRTQSAHHLSRRESNRVGGKPERIQIQIVSAGEGVLREIHGAPGARVEEGTLLAIFSQLAWEPEAGQPIDYSKLSEFKVVAVKQGA